ncbi:hypothetical protein BSYN_06460 [Bacteroides sedimenti]|uniref:Uncharacterized protein n=1 Tax=Bacteroides sedimenti TaxID=2136147 RepID=A0ABN6Z7T6_9BACE
MNKYKGSEFILIFSGIGTSSFIYYENNKTGIQPTIYATGNTSFKTLMRTFIIKTTNIFTDIQIQFKTIEQVSD